MATNYVNSGERITYTVPLDTTVESGSVVVVENKVFVALSGGEEGEEITLARTGRFALPKAGEIIYQGETVYWDPKYDRDPARGLGDELGAMTSFPGSLGGGNIKAGIAGKHADDNEKTVEVILITAI